MRRRWVTIGAWALSVGPVGCATSTPPPSSPPPGPAAITFHNTTDQCAVPVSVTVQATADAPPVAVPPGGRERITLPPGGDALAVATGAGNTPPVGRDGDEVFVGCAHPAFARADAGSTPVMLEQREHACEDGPWGMAAWELEGAPVAATRPGTTTARWLPAAARELFVGLVGHPGDGPRAVPAAEAGPPGRRFVLGCGDGARAGGHLWPLTVWVSAEGCARPGPVGLILAGRRLVLPPGGGYTVSLPTGRHLVTPFDPDTGAPVGEVRAVELSVRGALLRWSACPAALVHADAPDSVGDLVPGGDVR